MALTSFPVAGGMDVVHHQHQVKKKLQKEK
jgi:hypothetical protein